MATENRGVEGWVTTIFLLFYATGSTKKCHLKILHFGQFFLFEFVKFCDS